MNRNSALIALVLAAAATGAFADDITIDPVTFVSTRSRAEVKEELAQFQKAGVDPHAISYNPLAYFNSEHSRAQVEQQYLASREEERAMMGEDSGSSWLMAHRAHPASVTYLAAH